MVVTTPLLWLGKPSLWQRFPVSPRLLHPFGRGYNIRTAMTQHYFTLEEARSLLPWLREKLSETSVRQERARTIQARMEELVWKSKGNGGAQVDKEISELVKELEEARRHMQAALADISQRGIIVRDLARGLVDFPSQRDGRGIYLCWVMGEEEIAYWHDMDKGFASRQPLP